MKTFLFYLVSITALLLTSCSSPVPETEAISTNSAFCIPDSLMKNITLDTVRSEYVMSDLKLSGKITFNENNVVKVFPLVGGNVTDVKVSLGDHVQKGQLLAVVRSSDMANYYNDYESAQSELAIAKKNMEVTADMRNSGVSSEKGYLTAQSEYQKALAQSNKVNEVLRIYGSSAGVLNSNGSAYTVKAPISGFIVEKNVNTGMQLRSDDANNLFTISNLKEVWATANVYETDIAKIKPGSETEITTLSYPDKKFSGKVERISNILNPETNVMTVKIRLSNPDYTLKPGMFANISILFPEAKKDLVVPARSVMFDDNKNYVVLFKKRCDVSMQPVNIYKAVNKKIYIENDSLHEGDLVVAQNGLFVFTALKKL
ncbi:MAG TPA: efflux RND transporter periplasmic adaptor subunit [Chitinophagaceae bacterium]|nr:efflux RND transporter periplasmic adaptor subunit [Chitinophagaceae bacterium]